MYSITKSNYNFNLINNNYSRNDFIRNYNTLNNFEIHYLSKNEEFDKVIIDNIKVKLNLHTATKMYSDYQILLNVQYFRYIWRHGFDKFADMLNNYYN
jgi:hypothetical protein